MKRIFITMTLMVVLIGVTCVQSVLAADRNYNVKNCERSIAWPEILKDIRWDDPELKQFIEENIKPTQQNPKLTEEDYQQIEQFDKKIQWYVSECILLMKEVNILNKAIHDKNPEQTFSIGFNIKRTFAKLDIPFIYHYNMDYDFVFSVNFAPLTPGKTF